MTYYLHTFKLLIYSSHLALSERIAPALWRWPGDRQSGSWNGIGEEKRRINKMS